MQFAERGPADARLRVLVLEDERAARAFLVELIESSGLATIAGAVADVDEAEAMLATHAVDVAFLDIQLFGAERDGMSLVRACAGRPDSPRLVLATALREHALEAFELGVVDYVTKPFSRIRVVQCLTRLADVRRRAPTVHGRVAARKGRSLVFLAAAEIWCVQSVDRLAYVHCVHGVFDIDLSLSAVEAAFSPSFVRVHRNWLVNTAYVRELCREDGESTLAVGVGYRPADPGIQVPIAKERAQEVRELLLGASVGVRRR